MVSHDMLPLHAAHGQPPGVVTVTEALAAPAPGAALSEPRAYAHPAPPPVPVPLRATFSVGLAGSFVVMVMVAETAPTADDLKRMM
jgi:hypothetical protein